MALLLDELIESGEFKGIEDLLAVYRVTDLWDSLKEHEWRSQMQGLIDVTPSRMPHQNMWIEYRAESQADLSGYDPATRARLAELVRRRVVTTCGVRLESIDAHRVARIMQEAITAEYGHTRHGGMMRGVDLLIERGAVTFNVGAVWEKMQTLTDPHNPRLNGIVSIGLFAQPLDATGKVINLPPGYAPNDTSNETGPVILAFPITANESDEAYRNGSNNLADVAMFCAYTCSMLHVRNIGTTAHVPAEGINRNRVRKGKPPLVTFHTLTVTLPRKQGGGAPTAPGQGKVMPFHTVAGHYKHYRDEDGHRLLGKWSGTLWVDSHARGDRALGERKKEYRLRPQGLTDDAARGRVLAGADAPERSE